MAQATPILETPKCCDGVEIPPMLPAILQKYTMSAIITQPKDLLIWSAAYFRSITNGVTPPVKDRLEYPIKEAKSGLTPGLLRIIHKQIGDGNKTMSWDILKPKWRDVCLNPVDAQNILTSNGLQLDRFSWLQFVALASVSIENNLMGAIDIIFHVLTNETNVKQPPSIPFDQFKETYKFIAEHSFNIPQRNIHEVCSFLEELLESSNRTLIKPEDLKHPQCPQL